MKLYTMDNTELMDVSAIRTEGASLVVIGTIMGAMPTEAVLKPAELRQAFKLISPKVIWCLIKMLFAK